MFDQYTIISKSSSKRIYQNKTTQNEAQKKIFVWII